MARKRTPRTPSYRYHSTTGQGYVEFDGRRHYLGKYQKPAPAAYHRLIAEWTENGYRLPVAPDDITVQEVIEAYVLHCAAHYVDTDGKPLEHHQRRLRLSFTPIRQLYGPEPATAFGPQALRATRHTWVDRGLSISTINERVALIKRMFKWSVSREMVPVEVHQRLDTLENLQRGRGMGKDPVKRSPVPLATVEATLDHLPPVLWAVANLLRHTGARPSEVLNLRRGDIDASGLVWVAIIRQHKTSLKGKERRLFFGPRAQAVLRPYLLRNDDAYMFSPAEAERERYQRQAKDTVGRRENQQPNPKKTDRVVGESYDAKDLARAIRRVCDKHGIDRWTPYQLRHLFATTAEATSDWETARILLGHSSLDTTKIYVTKDNATASAWALQHG